MPFEIPQSVDDVLDANATFEPAALAAVRKFARSKPWQGSDQERVLKFSVCATELAAAYGLEPWTVSLWPVPGIDRDARVLTFRKLSVVTFLHGMAIVRGLPPFGCFRWSINLFKRCFPRSFAACRQHGPYLVRS